MSLDLPLVSLVMYLQEGEVNPGDEGKVIRFEKKMSDWRRDVVGGSTRRTTTKILRRTTAVGANLRTSTMQRSSCGKA
jgi:hypothetical protein